jgi:hypothetical protein
LGIEIDPSYVAIAADRLAEEGCGAGSEIQSR